MPPRKQRAEPPLRASNSEPQYDDHMPTDPPSMTKQAPSRIPFSDQGAPHLVLPPISLFLPQSASQPAPIVPATYNPIAAPTTRHPVPICHFLPCLPSLPPQPAHPLHTCMPCQHCPNLDKGTQGMALEAVQ
jgi:hypothetical protein